MSDELSNESEPSPKSLLRFLSKDLCVDTNVKVIGDDWYIILSIECEEDDAIYGSRPEEDSRPATQNVELDLIRTKLNSSERVNEGSFHPGTYIPESKRLIIGSRRLGKRKCCSASAPCIGTVPIQLEFQKRFNLPSFIHVSICYSEFEKQLLAEGNVVFDRKSNNPDAI